MFDFSALPPVRPAIALLRTSRCPQNSDRLLQLLHRWLGSIGRHAPERLLGTPCRTARRNESWAIPSLCRATPSATSEHSMGLLGSSPIPRSLVASCVSFQRRPLPSPGVTRLLRYCGPLRHPKRPGLTLTSFRLIRLRSPLGLPVLRLVPFVCMPSPIPRQDQWDCSLVFSHRRRPSLDSRRVGSCITRFGACTAFTLKPAVRRGNQPA